MQRWVRKSSSDTETVYALVDHGQEQGRYRYVFNDDRENVEVGALGLEGRSRTARNPRTVRHATLAAGVLAVALGDIAWRLVS